MLVSNALSLSRYFSPEIHPSREFADAYEIGTSYNIVFERRFMKEAIERLDRADISEKPQSLSHCQKPLFGAPEAVGSLSNLGSPTAEKSTASAFMQILKVSSGKGSPVFSMASAPQMAYS